MRIFDALVSGEFWHVSGPMSILVNGWLRLEPGESKSGDGRQFPLMPETHGVLESQLARTREIEKATGQVIPWLFHQQESRSRVFGERGSRHVRKPESRGESLTNSGAAPRETLNERQSRVQRQ
jgi:hypothetical protein